VPRNAWIFFITSSTPAIVLQSSLFFVLRLALLRFSNLWANLNLESRQQLTHTFTYTTPPSAEGEEIFVYYAGSPAAAQLSRVKRFMETFLRTVWGPLERLF
jgi:hypothetical protein